MASPEVLNELFAAKLDTEEGKHKIAAYTSAVTRDHLREQSFADSLLPPTPVQRSDLQVSMEHDTLIKIEFLEAESRALPVSFRGEVRARVIRAGRYGVPFFTIMTEKYEKTEQELAVYPYPITKQIEENMPKDMGEVFDREFLIHCESAVQRLQLDANNNTATSHTGDDQLTKAVVAYGVTKGELAQLNATQTSFEPLPIQAQDLTNLYKLFLRSTGGAGGSGRLRCDRFLMTEYDFEDIMAWTVEDTGNKVQSEVIVDGWKYNALKGRKFTRTVKTDILREGNIFAFAAPEFFGKSYILNSIKFYIDKIGNRMTWWAWMDRGMAIGNISAVRKMELYPGSIVPGQVTVPTDTSLAADRAPKAAEDLGALSHRADQGYTYPNVVQY